LFSIEEHSSKHEQTVFFPPWFSMCRIKAWNNRFCPARLHRPCTHIKSCHSETQSASGAQLRPQGSATQTQQTAVSSGKWSHRPHWWGKQTSPKKVHPLKCHCDILLLKHFRHSDSRVPQGEAKLEWSLKKEQP